MVIYSLLLIKCRDTGKCPYTNWALLWIPKWFKTRTANGVQTVFDWQKIVYVIEICWQCFHRVTFGDFSNSLKRFLICLLGQSIVVDQILSCEARGKYFERVTKLIFIIMKKYLNFTSTYTHTRHTTGTSPLSRVGLSKTVLRSLRQA